MSFLTSGWRKRFRATREIYFQPNELSFRAKRGNCNERSLSRTSLLKTMRLNKNQVVIPSEARKPHLYLDLYSHEPY